MKKFVIQAIVLLLVIVGALVYSVNKTSFIPRQPSEPSKTSDITIGNTAIKVEVADTPAVRAKGLGGRDKLAADFGMLFIFEKPGRYPFWMKGLNFPLDFIYIKDSKVVDMIKNVPNPPPGEKDQNLLIYMPNQEVDMVLEVNAGFIDAHNIKVGDQVKVGS